MSNNQNLSPSLADAIKIVENCEYENVAVHVILQRLKALAATPPDTPEPLTPEGPDLLWVNPEGGFVANHQAGSAFIPYRRVVDGEGEDPFDALAAEVVEVCNLRGWSLHWTERGAYLHLEASELIEAVRGKRGDPATEAGDVLFVLLSILHPKGIVFADVVAALRMKVGGLKIKPRYASEQFKEKTDAN